jgi:hypothetical protein
VRDVEGKAGHSSIRGDAGHRLDVERRRDARAARRRVADELRLALAAREVLLVAVPEEGRVGRQNNCAEELRRIARRYLDQNEWSPFDEYFCPRKAVTAILLSGALPTVSSPIE